MTGSGGLYNILILYQAKDGTDRCKWFRTIERANDFVDAENFHPWIACFDRNQFTGKMRRVFEKGQRK